MRNHIGPARPGNDLPPRPAVSWRWYAATVAAILAALLLGGAL